MVDPKIFITLVHMLLIIINILINLINRHYSTRLYYTIPQYSILCHNIVYCQLQSMSNWVHQIMEKVLIGGGVETTCYFPHSDKLRRLFLIYAGTHLESQLQGFTNDRELEEFILCFVLLKEWQPHATPTACPVSSITRAIATAILGSESQCARTFPVPPNYTINQANLISLLTALIGGNRNKTKGTIYDFNLIDSDETSLCIDHLVDK